MLSELFLHIISVHAITVYTSKPKLIFNLTCGMVKLE